MTAAEALSAFIESLGHDPLRVTRVEVEDGIVRIREKVFNHPTISETISTHHLPRQR